MSVPTFGEVYAKLIEDISHAQEGASMLGHLTRAEDSSAKQVALADGWLAISEMFKRLNYQVTKLATKKLN